MQQSGRQSSLRVVSQASQTTAARSDGVIPTAPVTGNAPHTDKAGFRKSYCDQPTTNSTLPREAWTLNVHAVDDHGKTAMAIAVEKRNNPIIGRD